MRPVAREFLRFLVMGVLNTAASYAVYFVLLPFMHYLVAYAIAYAFGILLSYALMTRFVFRTAAGWSTAVRFPLVYVLQFLAGSAVTWLLVEVAGVGPALAAAIAIVAVVPLTFAFARHLFRGRRDGARA